MLVFAGCLNNKQFLKGSGHYTRIALMPNHNFCVPFGEARLEPVATDSQVTTTH